MRITVNPLAQASGDFGCAAPGDYELRLVACEQKQAAGKEWPYLQWEFEFADPNVPSVEKNSDGTGKKLSHVYEITTLKPDAQFALRDICEGLGLTWGDFDTDSVKGLSAKARIKMEIYNNKPKNVIDRFQK